MSENRLNTGQQRIKGYRDLTQRELDVMNAIKEAEAAVLATLEVVRELHDEEADGTVKLPDGMAAHVLVGEGVRWREMAEDFLQTGFMQLARSVARPLPVVP